MARTCALVVGLLLLTTPAAAQLKIATGSASAAADAVVDRIDAGSGPGTLVIFGSACPDAANDADSGTILAVLTFSDPAFGNASNGVATANAITADASANATGTAMCFRAKDSNAVVVLQGRITTSGGGGELILSSTSIKTGQSVAVSDLTYTQPTQTADIFAPSCSAADVETALDAAEAGDVIAIPAGTCNWSTQIVWTAPANVFVRGAGSLSTLGGGDATVIVDDYTSSGSLLAITGSATGTLRIAGLTFRGGSSGANTKYTGFLSLTGGSSRISARLDHLTMDTSTYATAEGRGGSCMAVSGVYGLIDHSVFPDTNGNCIRIYNPDGHQAWAEATGLGTDQWTFVEDNTFGPGLANDCQAGGKMVWRYNTFTNTGIQVHATGGTGTRGCRAWEIYGNTFTDSTDPPYQTIFWGSSGTGLIWGNTTGGTQGYKNLIQLFAYRRNSNTNTATKTPDGFGYCGPARASGTVNVSSGAGTTLTKASGDNFSTTNWPDNSMIIVDGTSFEIVSVASTTSLTIRQADAADLGGTGPLPSTKAGMSGVAYSVGSHWDGNTDAATGYPCIDTPGRGQGDLITGTSPNMTNSATSCISSSSCAWLRQALEPVYEWLNPFTPAAGYGGMHVNAVPTDTLLENRDYYKYTESFTGATGVGSGVRSSRPSTCTTGVAYWSTDQGGNWNTVSGGSNDGTLDVCTATNTWTNAVYTPYTYPHPLQ